MLGKAPDDAIKAIAAKMKSSQGQAGRLVMTESAYFASQSQKDAFNTLDVERFEIVATLDSNTSEICRELDGHVEEMKNYEPGVTAPPFHPFVEPLLYHTLTIMTVRDSPEIVVVKVFIFRQMSLIMSGKNNL